MYSYSSYLNVFLFQGLEFKCIRIPGETVTTSTLPRVYFKGYHISQHPGD